MLAAEKSSKNKNSSYIDPKYEKKKRELYARITAASTAINAIVEKHGINQENKPNG
jgi:hypothetical protein